MLNSFMLVGRIKSIENREGICVLIMNVPKKFKNDEGKYDSDLIKIRVMENLADTLKKYCNINDIIAVKGRIQSDNILSAEKITCLDCK